MRIYARRRKGCAYPPIGSYMSNDPFKGKLKAIEIKPCSGADFPQLRPDGARQPAAEATILGKMIIIKQGRAGFPDVDIESGRG